MTQRQSALVSRIKYFWWRLRNLDPASVWRRARTTAKTHDKNTVGVLVDMLWSAGFRDTPFQDYIDWDFAALSRAERATFMTNALSNHMAEKYDDPRFRRLFEDKIEFNRRFSAFIDRDWLDIRDATGEEVREFVNRFGAVIAKVPVSNSGYGVEKYEAAGIADGDAFRDDLLRKGQFLVEEYIRDQHPALRAVAPGVVNTTRVTTFFDGETVHILSFAQKFGIGTNASDQQAFGGFFTLLDLDGDSLGPGYGSHQRIYATHPETGASIVDFRLPMAHEVIELVTRASKIVPEIPYVGWDVVVLEKAPTLLEGNWMPGAYENKPSATGRRTGSRARFRELMPL